MNILYKSILLSLIACVAHAEDMIDPKFITPIDCPVEVKPEPIQTVIKEHNFGYRHSDNIYTLDKTYVNTYTLVEVDGIMYKKFMVFSDSKWTDVLIKK